MADSKSLPPSAKYISLETYRRSGAAVRTPVWFAAAPDAAPPRYYVFTTATSGKAKRIRREPRARIAVCDARGGVSGSWMEAHVEMIGGEEANRAMQLLGRKYFPLKQVLDLSARVSGRIKERVVLAVRPM